MALYPIDDIVLSLSEKKISRFKFIAQFLLFSVFLFFLCFRVVPSIYKVIINQKIFEEEKVYFYRSQQLSKKVRKELDAYLNLKKNIDKYLSLDTPYVNSKVFDTIISLLHKVGIYDVYLKIGKMRIEKENEGICFVVVPVQIKAYVEYPHLSQFFKVLGQNLVYKVQKLEIKWSKQHGKEKVLLDVEVLFKYKENSNLLRQEKGIL